MEPRSESNLQQMLQQAQRMQEQLMSLQHELAETEVEGTAGGGLVIATMDGKGQLVKLVIDPAAIDATDPADTAETVADLVVVAIRNAEEKAQRLQETKAAPLTESLSGLRNGLPGDSGLPGR